MVLASSSGANLRVLRTVLTKAFKIRRPVFAMVYNAYYDVCMERECASDVVTVVKAALLQGGQKNGMNEAQFKDTATRVGNAMTYADKVLDGYALMVTDAWIIIERHAAAMIQKEWRFAQSCPGRSLCYKRLMEEWLVMKDTLV